VISSAYEPFLLPLAGEFFPIPEAPVPTNPLEEEAALQATHADWVQLASLARRAYGLPFLIEAGSGFQVKLPAKAQERHSPERFLLIDKAGETWFVMEHPSVLPLFDQLCEIGQRPALCRPALFAQWFTGIDPLRTTVEHHKAPPQTEDRNTVRALHRFLNDMVRASRPSDWHLEPGKESYSSRLRVDGQLEPAQNLSSTKGQWLINSITHQAGLGNEPAGHALDGSFTLPGENEVEIPLRISLVPSLHGMALVTRFLYPDDGGLRELPNLGLRGEQIARINESLQRRDGLWLLAGPTGSGKSTTLHALLTIAANRNEKVLAAEDPVESVIPGVQHVQVSRRNGFTYANLLRAFMRQAPDSILIGEIRDAETAAIALEAAYSGHRILSTIHASSNEGIRHRFSDLGQPAARVTGICERAIHQRLVRKTCPHCHIERPVSKGEVRRMASMSLAVPGKLVTAQGCPVCKNGFRGRTGVYAVSRLWEDENEEFLLLEAVWSLILRGLTSLECVYPHLPRAIRSQFPLCQV
jgi:type IV pilus assembly protein PilB